MSEIGKVKLVRFIKNNLTIEFTSSTALIPRSIVEITVNESKQSFEVIEAVAEAPLPSDDAYPSPVPRRISRDPIKPLIKYIAKEIGYWGHKLDNQPELDIRSIVALPITQITDSGAIDRIRDKDRQC